MPNIVSYVRAVAVSFALVAPLLPWGAEAEERLQLQPIEGFYIGTFAGAIVLDSTIVFPATETRSSAKFVDQGGDGVLFGARAGWGTLVTRRVYVGGELEGIVPWNVTSRLMAFGVEYRSRLRSELGAYGRVGWSPNGQSLMFVRAGLTIPRQVFQSVRDGVEDSADWTPVPTFGVGMEAPLSRRIGMRLDGSYSWPHGNNRFESYRLTVGITYRF